MATKATIQASIATINDGGANTALEVRNVFTTELDNAYGTVSTELFTASTDATPNTTPVSTSYLYNLKMVKQGRVVTVSGTVTNNSGIIISSQKFFDIDAGEWLPDVSKPIFFYGFTQGTASPTRFLLVGSNFSVISSLGSTAIPVWINFQYFTLD